MPDPEPPEARTFAVGTRLFVYALAFAHAAAFASIWAQWAGLFGPSGILPGDQYLSMAHAQLGPSAWFEVPTLCWFFGANHFVPVACATGIILSVLLVLYVAPAICLA